MHYLSLSLYIHTVNLAADGTRALSEEATPIERTFRDAPFGGLCVETMELESREPTINTPPLLSQHPKGIHEKERCWFEERRNRVRRNDTTQRWGSHAIAWIHDIVSETKKLGKIECVFSLYDKIRWKWDDVYLLRSLPNMYSLSLFPLPLPLYLHTPAVATWWCTWRLWLSEFGDLLGARNRASLEI